MYVRQHSAACALLLRPPPLGHWKKALFERRRRGLGGQSLVPMVVAIPTASSVVLAALVACARASGTTHNQSIDRPTEEARRLFFLLTIPYGILLAFFRACPRIHPTPSNQCANAPKPLQSHPSTQIVAQQEPGPTPRLPPDHTYIDGPPSSSPSLFRCRFGQNRKQGERWRSRRWT